MPAATRRHRCVKCGTAKETSEFGADAVTKGIWTCLGCVTVVAATASVRADTVARQVDSVVSRPAVVRPAVATRAPSSGSVGAIVQQYIADVNAAVAAGPSCPWPGLDLPPLSIPFVDRLLAAAGNLDCPGFYEHPGQAIMTIQTLLSRGKNYDFRNPSPLDGPLQFPKDHHFHPQAGFEWYWVGAKLPIKDAAGNTGEVSILSSIQRTRAVGLTRQAAAGWTDDQVTIMCSVTTAAVRMFDENKKVTRTVFTRASRNVRFGAMEPGTFYFSKPGDQFRVAVGSASLSSAAAATAAEIAPFTYSIDDEVNGVVNIKATFTMASQPGINPNQGWFLQGMPVDLTSPLGKAGSGYTYEPSPGIYYSWPQLNTTVPATANTVTVNGEPFTVTGPGTSWIDHQLMGTSMTNPGGAVQPIPFAQDAAPVNGWTWQFVNSTDKNSAYTAACFMIGSAANSALGFQQYGYYITKSNGVWVGAFTFGGITEIPSTWVTGPAGLPVNASGTLTPPNAPFVSAFQVPNSRSYLVATGMASPPVFAANAKGWLNADGTVMRADFNNVDMTSIVECPSDWTSVIGTPYGWGYLEAVSLEPSYALSSRQLKYLSDGQFPDNGPYSETSRAPGAVLAGSRRR